MTEKLLTGTLSLNTNKQTYLQIHLGPHQQLSVKLHCFYAFILFFKQIESLTINTPGNVVRGSQSYANRMGASGYCSQTVHRMSTNVLSCYSLSTQTENRQLGSVVLNTFHFYKKLNRNSRGKTSGQRLI